MIANILFPVLLWNQKRQLLLTVMLRPIIKTCNYALNSNLNANEQLNACLRAIRPHKNIKHMSAKYFGRENFQTSHTGRVFQRSFRYIHVNYPGVFPARIAGNGHHLGAGLVMPYTPPAISYVCALLKATHLTNPTLNDSIRKQMLHELRIYDFLFVPIPGSTISQVIWNKLNLKQFIWNVIYFVRFKRS